jgi:hypothetical protein
MKTALICGIIFLVLTSSRVNSQITLSAGKSFSYEFEGLAYEGNSTFGIAEPSGAVFLNIDPWDPWLLGPTNSYKVEMFEGTTADPPILSRIITYTSSIHDTTYRVPNAWGDLRGTIRVTALTGSIKLLEFSLQAFKTSSLQGFDIYGTDRIWLPDQPSLSIVSTSGALTLDWPLSGTNFVLEATFSLIPPTSWTPVTNGVTANGRFSVQIQSAEPARFFRLRWLGP